MKQSKFIKLTRDILFEYIYDDTNLIGEDYKVLTNIQDGSKSFLSTDTSGTKNIISNQLFQIDPIFNKWGKVDTILYNFLQTSDYSGGVPIRHDRIKIHTGINYTFSEYIGFHIKCYVYDFSNQTTFTLSDYYYDITDVSRFGELGFSTPPLLFQEKLWGKNIEIDIPSLYTLSNQRDSGVVRQNSINFNLTNGVGLSQTAPIFFEFNFIESKQVINGITTYKLSSPINSSVPQSPEFESLSIVIEESTEGDFFNIYGAFNGNISEFKKFIDDSYYMGHRYYVKYVVTTYEENIKGKTKVFTVTEDFNQKIEERPIIKFSTTTAVIDVEMQLIDLVDESQIIRRASYGMLSDQISKYSLNLTKINIKNSNKPKIYNLKNVITNSNFGINNSVVVEQVKVPYPVFVEKNNIVAKSENVKVKTDTYYGIGKLQLSIMPFDNIITISIAESIVNDQVKLMDLSNSPDVRLVFQNTQLSSECLLYNDQGGVDLQQGFLIFKIFKKQIPDLRKIHDSTINTFYIISNFEGNTTVIYSGTFRMFDSNTNVNTLNQFAVSDQSPTSTPLIIDDKNTNKGTAIVTRRQIIK